MIKPFVLSPFFSSLKAFFLHPSLFLLGGVVIGLITTASAQVLATKDSVEVHRTDTIYFDFGRAEIRPFADSVLQKMQANYKPGLQLYLEGHTDAVGSVNANAALARRRTASVHQRMLALGWPAADLVTRSFGETKLVVPTQGREERNRRVFIRSGLPQVYSLFRGQAVDTTGAPLPASVIAHGKYLRDTTLTDADGFFEIWLPIDQVVGLDVYAPGYFYETNLMKVKPDQMPSLRIALRPAVSGARMDVPDLFFVGNQTVLLSKSKPALPRLLTFMQLNPLIKIEIA
ncbi:MAG: OmpA family protein, partial [Bacteroidota bacterium]